jgi:ketosteroid isomerase-like protein
MNVAPASHAVVRDFVASVNAGAGAWALLAPGVVVTVNGTTPLSGRYPGVELVRGILVDTARAAIGSLAVEIDSLIGAGARVAALLRISGSNHSGVRFNADGRLCGCVFGVRDACIEEILLYPDTSLIEIALYGRRFVADG